METQVGHYLPRSQGPPGLRGSNDCTSPLPYAVHQVGVQVQEDDVAVVHHRHQALAHPPATSPQSDSKLLGAGHKGLRCPSGLLGTPAGPDAVVPVTESWDRGQHVQVIGRGQLLRALDLQDPKNRMNDGCQGWKMPQSPWKPWAFTPGGWRACSPWRQQSSIIGVLCVPLLDPPCSTSLLPPYPPGLQTTCPPHTFPPVPASEPLLTLFPRPL